MNDARALSRDVALLAGSLGDLVQMDVMGRVAAQNLEALFALGVARSDPQQESAVVQMLIEMLGVLVTDVARQSCRDQTAGSAGNRRCNKYTEQRATGGRHREAAEHCRHVDAGADDGALRIADRFVGDVADARDFWIVLELGGRLMRGTELRGDRVLMGEHINVGMVEADRQQIVNGRLEGFNIVENRDWPPS